MREIYIKYENNIKELLSYKRLVILLGITTILSYGFAITNFSIGVDDTAFNRYFREGELLAQGRFAAVALDKIFNMFDFAPFWMDMVATILLVVSSLLWCSFIMEVTKNKLPKRTYIIFSTLFISYPIISQIFIYMMTCVPVGLGHVLTIISLICLYEFIINKKRSINIIIIGIIAMTFTISLYEAFATVFICGIFITLILIYFYSRNNDKNENILKKYFIIFLKYIGILAICILLEAIISNVVIFILGIEKSSVAATSIQWFEEGSIINKIVMLLKQIIYSYIINSKYFIFIFIFDLACLIAAVMAIISAIKNKSITIFLLFLGIGLSNIALCIVQGEVSPYRTCLTFPVFVSFIFMLLFLKVKKEIYMNIVSLVIFIIVVIQTKEMNQAFFNDYQRYVQDREIAIQIATIINYEFDNTKPIVYLGEIPKYDNIKYIQSNGMSVINWGVRAFGENNTELLNFMKMNGYTFKQANDEQMETAKKDAINMPSYPHNGYIEEFDDYIIVKFS